MNDTWGRARSCGRPWGPHLWYRCDCSSSANLHAVGMSIMVQRETDSDRSSDSGLASPGFASSGLHGMWLLIAHGAWVALVALAAFLVVNGMSAQLAAPFSVSSLSQADPRY